MDDRNLFRQIVTILSAPYKSINIGDFIVQINRFVLMKDTCPAQPNGHHHHFTGKISRC